MDKIKKSVGRIWNSKCKYLVIIAFSLILVNGVNLLQTSLKFVNQKGEMVEEVKSVVITSETWESKGPGSFQVTKSADWTGYKKATIRFDVETNRTNGSATNGMDVILVLDNSGSMGSKVNGKQKLVRLKEDTISLVESLLLEGNNRIAVIPFQSSVKSILNFTSDKGRIVSVLNGMSASGGNNFIKAYEAVNSLLQDYKQEKDRSLIMIFLTDGLNNPREEAREQYAILKDKYDISISGIQYELGTKMSQAVIEISDVQYMADAINLKNIFVEITGEEAYEEFEITDYISEEFEIENISDIRVSRGEVKLETDKNGKQKVIWRIPTSDVKFITCYAATMEIDVTFKGEADAKKIYKTNEKEKVKVKLPRPGSTPWLEEIESEETPGIRGGYYVIYDPNLPSSCNPSGENRTVKVSKFAYETVDKFYGNYNCSGWQLKGWEIEPGIPSLGDDKFEMPNRDITVKALWTKLELSKTMEGTVYEVPKKDLLVAMKEKAGPISVDSSIKFWEPSSETNGRGLYIRSGTENDTNPVYYYRGAVENNNVLFAGICWQIVRTTETGGIKLIYNGVSSDGRSCKNTGDSFIGEDVYNPSKSSSKYSIGDVGYMTGEVLEHEDGGRLTDGSKSFLFGEWVSYDSSTNQYTLQDYKNIQKFSYNRISDYKYTCWTSGRICEKVFYVYQGKEHFNSVNVDIYYISLSNGQRTVREALEERFSNEHDSNVKKVIDGWYKKNIDDKGYTKYLDQDTVWCNDRKFVSGGLYLENPNVKNASLFTAYGSRYLNGIKGALSSKIDDTLINPSLDTATICPNMADRFTTASANTGNKKLTYPVGMLTADEVIFAGMAKWGGKNSYLYTGYNYWTMTPIDASHASVGIVSTSEDLYYRFSGVSLAIRPSITLKRGTLIYAPEAEGTLEHPYEVVTK